MYLENLHGKNFRNFSDLDLKIEPGLCLIMGENGVGKTNLLELIYFISTFGSFRTSYIKDLIKFDEEFMVASGLYGDRKVRIHFSGNRSVFIDDIEQDRISDAFGTIPAIAMTSEDMEIVNGSPGRRRKFLNIAISLFSKSYIDYLSKYNRILKQRNKLLKDIKEKNHNPDEITVWDRQLSKISQPIVKERIDFINKIKEKIMPVFESLTEHQVDVNYMEGGDYSNLEKQLAKKRKVEIERGYSLYGPHRDDISLKVNNHPASTTASFGIKRILTVALRLSVAEILHEIRKEEPLILMDEIIGELDKKRTAALLEHLKNYQQVLIATARENIIDNDNINAFKIEEEDGTPTFRRCTKKVHKI